MKQLLMKEYHAYQSTIAMTLGAFIFAAIVLSSGKQVPAFLTALLAGTFVFSTTSYVDEKNNSEVMMVSLPVNRTSVISARYVSGLFMGGLLLVLTILLNLFIPLFSPLSALSIAMAAAATMILLSLYFPLFLIFGPQWMGYAFIAVLLLIVGVVPFILGTSFIERFVSFIQQQSDLVLIITLLAVAIVILITSWIISVRLFLRRQF